MFLNDKKHARDIVHLWVKSARHLHGLKIHEQMNAVAKLLLRRMAGGRPSLLIEEIVRTLSDWALTMEDVGTDVFELDQIQVQLDRQYNRAEIERLSADETYHGMLRLKETMAELRFTPEDVQLTSAELDRRIEEARIMESRAVLEAARKAVRPGTVSLHCQPEEIGSSVAEITALRMIGEARWYYGDSFFSDERAKARPLAWKIFELLMEAEIEPERIGSSYDELNKLTQ